MGSFFRYPGGKGKLAPPILWAIEQIGEGKPLIEACCGSAAIGVQYAKRRRAQPIWLNDRDPGIAALWRAAIHRPAELKALIRAFKPSLEAFATFQSELLAGGVEDECEHGFKKLALHQMSYSGLGLRAGGPMGDIGCRWSPDRLCVLFSLRNLTARGKKFWCKLLISVII